MTGLHLLCGLTAALASAAQSPQQPPATSQPAAEMVSQDAAVTFKSRTNVVLVPVVVRDSKGLAVGELRREDFQLFDRDKPQTTTSFNVERQARPALSLDPEQPPATATAALPDQPDRFVVYLFDDIHLEFGDLAHARDAARRHFAAALEPGTRVALFSTSAQVMVDFTEDRAALDSALQHLRSHRTVAIRGVECPYVDYYVGNLIENQNDSEALRAVKHETRACPGNERASDEVIDAIARAAARRAAAAGEQNTRVALITLRNAVRRISVMPGRRSVVLASPGFLTSSHDSEFSSVMEQAIQSSVVINTLDARGLYALVPGGDASERAVSIAAAHEKELYRSGAATAEGAVLASLADGTGGTFFHNSNDLLEGFQRAAARPETIYVLGFSPQNLKLDGKFHNLKVALKEKRGVTVQARRGYYAPTQMADAAAQATEEIREALYSREELRDIPIEFNTQFFKPTEDTARLSVLVHLDLKAFQFRKLEGRNLDKLTLISALFDANGNYVTGVEKKIEMHLRDATLQARLASGITVKSTLDVKPGRYAIRLVVRESEGQLMAAQNGAVEIP